MINLINDEPMWNIWLSRMDLLTKSINKVDLTDLSKNCLLRTSPSYWGPALVRSKDSPIYDRILRALQSQKNSQLKLSNKDLMKQWQAGEINYKDAKQFTATMHATIFQRLLMPLLMEYLRLQRLY